MTKATTKKSVKSVSRQLTNPHDTKTSHVQPKQPIKPSTNTTIFDPLELSKTYGKLCFFIGDREGIKMMLLFLVAMSPRSVNDLEIASGLKASLISQHLNKLKDVGYVQSTKDGQKRIYKLEDKLHNDLKRLIEFLQPKKYINLETPHIAELNRTSNPNKSSNPINLQGD